MRRTLLTLAALSLSAVSWAETIQLRPEDLERMLREKNPAFQASGLAVNAAQTRTGSLQRSLLPTVSAMGGGERFETGRYSAESQPYGSVDASVNVFRGGKDRLEEGERKVGLKLAEAEREQVFRHELANVQALYWSLVAERERIAQIDGYLQRSGKLRQAAQRRVDRGLAANSDVLAFDLYTNQLREHKESAQHEGKILQMALATPLQLGKGVAIETLTQVPHDHDESLLTMKVDPAKSPRVQTLRAQTDMRSIEGQKAARWWMPGLDVYGQYALYTLRDRDYLSQSDRRDWATGVRAKMFLFDGLQSRRDSQASEKQTKALTQLTGYEAQSLETDVTLSQEELIHLHELIHGSELLLEQGQKLMSQILAEYDRGVRTSQDVLSTLDRVIGLRNQHIDRRLAYQEAKIKLLTLLGK